MFIFHIQKKAKRKSLNVIATFLGRAHGVKEVG